MREGPKKTICVVVPEELYQELSVLAEKSSRSMSAYIRQVFFFYLQCLSRFQGE